MQATHMIDAGLASKLRRCRVTEQLIFSRARSLANTAAWLCCPPAIAASRRRNKRLIARVFIFCSGGVARRSAATKISQQCANVYGLTGGKDQDEFTLTVIPAH